MIKLFEPFQSKIKLHIRQDFLQELWDKYVPVSSEAYDHISLIYLKGMPEDAGKGTKQVQILVDLALKNILMQINISQNPMFITQNVVSSSLGYTLKYYLAQLKRTDLQVFQSLNRYITYLKKAEEENIRYESWKKDSRTLRQMEKEYHILRQFSQSLRELSSVKLFEIEKNLGNELIRSMKKSEYRVFAKNMVWQEKQQIEEYIRSCSQTEYQQILERLEKEPVLYELVTAEKKGVIENKQIIENRHVLENRTVSENGNMPETENVDIESSPGLKVIWKKGQEISKESLIGQIEEHFAQEEFWKFYHKVVFPEKEMNSDEAILLPEKDVYGKEVKLFLEKDVHDEEVKLLLEKEMHSEEVKLPLEKDTYSKGADQLLDTSMHDGEAVQPSKGILIWKKNRKRMLHHLEQLSSEKVYHFWKQVREQIADVYEQQEEKKLKVQEKTEQRKDRQSLPDVYRTFSTKLVEMQEKYLLAEMQESLQMIVKEIQKQDGSEIIIRNRNLQTLLKNAEAAETTEKAEAVEKAETVEKTETVIEKKVLGEKETVIDKSVQSLETAEAIAGESTVFIKEASAIQNFRNQIDQIRQEVEHRLETQKDRIVEQEIETLNHYQDVLHLKEIIRDSLRQEEMRFHTNGSYEREFLLKYQNLHLSDTAIQKLWSWSKVLLTNTESELQSRIVNEHQEDSETVLENHVYGYGTNTEIFENPAGLDEDVIIEYRAEFQRLTEHLNDYGQRHSFHIEYRESSILNEEVQELLSQIHQMNEEQYSLFVTVLSDMMQVRQQIAREYIEKEMEFTQAVLQSSFTGVKPFDLESETERESNGIIGREESYYRDVEKIFRSSYGTQFTAETVRKLYEWSEVLQKSGKPAVQNRDTAKEFLKGQNRVLQNQDTANEILKEQESVLQNRNTANELYKNQESASQNQAERITTEDRIEFQKLIDRVNDHENQHSFHIEYMESSLTNESVQELLRETRQMNEEQYSLFIQVLSDMMQAQQIVRERMEREFTQVHSQAISTEIRTNPLNAANERHVVLQSENLYYPEVERIFHSNYGTVLTVEAVRKLYDWGKTLQIGSKPELRNQSQTTYEYQKERKTVPEEYSTVNEFQKEPELVLQVSDEKVLLREREELQKLIEQLNEYGEQHSFHIEYQESILTNESVRELLSQIRQTDSEQYSVFIKALSEMIRAQQVVWERMEKEFTHVVQQSLSTEIQSIDSKTEIEQAAALPPEELRYRDVEKVFRLSYGMQLTAAEVRELHDWSEALQTKQNPGQRESEELISASDQDNPDYIDGDMQTEIIRQHIQQAKDRSEFRQLVEQINHYAGETVHLEYREEQLRNPSVQTLIQHIRQLDEEHHRSFVRQLSKMIEIQQSMQAWESMNSESMQAWKNVNLKTTGLLEENVLRREHAVLYDQERELGNSKVNLLVRKNLPLDRRSIIEAQEKSLAEQEFRTAVQEKALADQRLKLMSQDQRRTDPTLRLSLRFRQRLYEIYPELVHRIQEYEAQRRKRYETELIQLISNRSEAAVLFRSLHLNMAAAAPFPGLDTGNISQAVLTGPETEMISETVLTGPEAETISKTVLIGMENKNTSVQSFTNLEQGKAEPNQPQRLLPEPQSYENRQDLKYTVSKGQIQHRQQELDGRIQEERIRMKSAQAQMDVRLKQVEQQLKKVEIQANGKEDVRETAEKIKKLLHEELHLEKLRRGMA